MAKQPSGFDIDGTFYPLPRLHDLTLDEERILYVYADTVLSDFVPPHPEADDTAKEAVRRLQMLRIRNPEFKRALAHIAYRRAHPDEDDMAIQSAIGKVNALAVELAIESLGDDEDRPPGKNSPKPHAKPKNSRMPSTPSASGRTTANGSDHPGTNHPVTGTTESDTFSPPLPAAM